MNAICHIDFSAALEPAAPRLRHRFVAPTAILVADCVADVRGVLDAVQAAAQQGRWCVGYVRYEAAPAFDAALRVQRSDGPLVWFAVYDGPQPWDGSAETSDGALGPDSAVPVPARTVEPHITWAPSLAREPFEAALARIQEAIRAGDLYQVNYTAAVQGDMRGRADGLFAALQRAQPDGYCAHLHMGNEQVLSVSPELFFDWCDAPGGGHILARPMKGTAPRGTTPEQDALHAQQLRASPKERAENVMVVDLLRNDLSRIAQAHSVQVPALFATQALPTVWQMTSDVTARTREGVGLTDVFAALFPCGSITGAPKVRAMQMIAELESAPRGIYCGAVGVVRPSGGVDAAGKHRVAATFNVPIRTVVLTEQSAETPGDQAGDKGAPSAAQGHALGGALSSRPQRAQRGVDAMEVPRFLARCGIGSGITSGSQASAEWAEWQHKRGFLERVSAPFHILETLGLHQGKFANTKLHVQRMVDAASHFGFSCNAHALRQELQITALQHRDGNWRVRLLLASDGGMRVDCHPLQPSVAPVRLQLADRPFEMAHSEFVRYKTTRRAHYEAFSPCSPGVFDTLLWNTQGEITESTFGNVAAFVGGEWITPPLSSGLLPGIGRAVALQDGWVTERVLRVDDVPRATQWAFINSLRGWLAATLQPGTT